MPRPLDLLVRNARLRRTPQVLCDIAIEGDRILAVAPRIDAAAADVIDADGQLVSEAFVNPHLHLCKVWSRDRLDEVEADPYHVGDMGQAMTAIERAAHVKAGLAQADIAIQARRAVALAALHGNLHIRAFADVDGKLRLEGVKALLQVREEFAGTVDIQVCAFAQDGIVREPGTTELLLEAMELGADVVGGIPWIEYTDEDVAEHIRVCFDLAQRFDKDISMLLDDAGDASLRTVELMAIEAVKRGWQGRALAHHCRAMALYPEPYFRRLLGSLGRGRVCVVSDPHTGPLHAKVKDLLAAGVSVSLGQDDISDAYYAFGRNNMLEVAFLAAHLLWMSSRRDVDTLFDMITVHGARAMNLPDYEIAPGARANLVVMNAVDPVEALRYHEVPLHVVAHGQRIDLARMKALARPPMP